MNKPTDNEIKKALEQQLKENKRIYSMDIVFLRSLVDLINRLEKKNEAYKYYYEECLKDLENAHTEAIKEFAKLLIDKSKNGVIHISDIPDYVKEISGGR